MELVFGFEYLDIKRTVWCKVLHCPSSQDGLMVLRSNNETWCIFNSTVDTMNVTCLTTIIFSSCVSYVWLCGQLFLKTLGSLQIVCHLLQWTEVLLYFVGYILYFIIQGTFVNPPPTLFSHKAVLISQHSLQASSYNHLFILSAPFLSRTIRNPTTPCLYIQMHCLLRIS